LIVWIFYGLILDTTNRKPVFLAMLDIVHVVVIVAHVPIVGEDAPVLRGRPPVAVVAGIVEIAIGVPPGKA